MTALVLASSAAAERRGLAANVEIRSSNGYDIDISAHRWRHPRRPGRATVFVGNGEAFSFYTAHATLTRHRLKANLGSFGRIALRYHAKSNRREPQRLAAVPPAGSLAIGFVQRLIGCAVSLNGTRGNFKGRIHFRGEDDYVNVHARRARGFISPATASCSKVREIHGVALDAKSTSAGSLAFEADHFHKQRGAFFIAQAREATDRVRIRRYALGDGPADSFTYDSGLRSARVEPIEDPFSGSATLTPSGEWAGSLAVSFPGAPDVPLAGPDFAARLRHF